MRYVSIPVCHMVCLYDIRRSAITYVGSLGFAVAGEYEDAKIKEAQEAAFEQMIQWLKSH